ncbi:acetyltransferase [Pelagibacteraceae bacterium]|nr:acetyltransferase [Pelagibacteraceae bacterium]
MKNIILIGAGGHCKSCIDVIESEKKYKIVGLIDKNKNSINKNYKILGDDNILELLLKKTKFALITLGQIKNSKKRENLFNKLKKIGFKFPSIISPFAYVSSNAIIGKGTIIMHGAVVNAGARVGTNCIINSKALIEHDAVVGNNCHLSTRSTLNGEVNVGDNSFIGTHTVIKQNVKISNNCFINGNLFVDKNIKANTKIYD